MRFWPSKGLPSPIRLRSRERGSSFEPDTARHGSLSDDGEISSPDSMSSTFSFSSVESLVLSKRKITKKPALHFKAYKQHSLPLSDSLFSADLPRSASSESLTISHISDDHWLSPCQNADNHIERAISSTTSLPSSFPSFAVIFLSTGIGDVLQSSQEETLFTTYQLLPADVGPSAHTDAPYVVVPKRPVAFTSAEKQVPPRRMSNARKNQQWRTGGMFATSPDIDGMFVKVINKDEIILP
ncbi:hypothetical protein CPC08DRAFT_796349 [Agrocybe pediades]|nr:hypothetical protein CPC08DRAFT_796349 [Agrocybe pediades]